MTNWNKDEARRLFMLAHNNELDGKAKHELRRMNKLQPSDKLGRDMLNFERIIISPRGEIYELFIEPYDFGFSAQLVDVIQKYVDDYNKTHSARGLRNMEYYYSDVAIGTVFIIRKYFPNYHGKKW